VLAGTNPATVSQINWQVLLFESLFCNFSFAVFPWSSVTPSINGSEDSRDYPAEKETGSVPEFKNVLLLLRI